MEIQTIASFLSYYETIRERTLRVVSLVPPDKLEWRHAPDVFSSGDLARHIAAVERYTIAENVFGRPSRYRGCGPELADGLENVLAFMDRLHRETVELLRSLTPDDLVGKGLTVQGRSVARSKLLRAMIEHEVHHRGEMYVYLALLGVPRPPLYGVTEPEVRRLSVEVTDVR